MRPTAKKGEYWYEPSGSSTGNRERYFYRFYDEDGVNELFAPFPFRTLRLERRQWEESGHPGFRDEPHQHVSWFAFLEKMS